MTKKMFGKRELIFFVVTLTIISILCIAKFMWTFIDACNFLSMAKRTFEGEDFPSMTSFNVVLIFSLVIGFVMLILPFMLLFIKSDLIKKNITLIVGLLVTMVVILLFVLRFTTKNTLSLDMIDDNINDTGSILLNTSYMINSLYLVASLLLSFVVTILCYALSNLILAKAETNKEKANEPVSDAELLLQNELKKIKEEIKLKELKNEIVKLTKQLNSTKDEK